MIFCVLKPMYSRDNLVVLRILFMTYVPQVLLISRRCSEC